MYDAILLLYQENNFLFHSPKQAKAVFGRSIVQHTNAILHMGHEINQYALR